MKAVSKYGFGDKEVEIRDVPEPEIGPEQVLVEVKATGVCGSDVHMWRNMQSWEIVLPLVLGHEFAGVIVDVGDNVSDWQIGDRVAVETAAEICGACVYCLSGDYNLCPIRLGYGALADGSMTRYRRGPPADPAPRAGQRARRARRAHRTDLRGLQCAGREDGDETR